MGLGGVSIWQLMIILVIVLLLFGTKRLRGIGTDLGNAIKGFKGAMKEGEEGKETATPETSQAPQGKVIDAEFTVRKDKDRV